MSRKDEAKRRYLNSKKGKFLKSVLERRGLPTNQISDTMLPDDYEFDGAKVVNGRFCRTVGEYKKALKKYN